MDKELIKQTITTKNIATYGNAVIAHANARKGKRMYKQVMEFEKDKEANLRQLVSDMADGTYRTGKYTLACISDGKKPRNIAKVPYRDRVAQWMLAIWYEPYFQAIICDRTHAAIKGRGIHSALKQVEKYIRHDGYKYCLEIDVRKYFPHIDRRILIDKLREDLVDDNIFGIVSNIILDGPESIIDDLGNTHDNGIPIGNYWSQFMANRYMVELNKWMLDKGIVFTQYMDNIEMFANDKQVLRRVRLDLQWELMKMLNLEIKPDWQIFPVTRGVDFVGYRIFPHKTTLRRDNFLSMRRKMSKILKELRNGKVFTDSMRSSVMSYLGTICHCTAGTRHYLYNTIFRDIVALSGIELSKKLRNYYDC